MSLFAALFPLGILGVVVRSILLLHLGKPSSTVNGPQPEHEGNVMEWPSSSLFPEQWRGGGAALT